MYFCASVMESPSFAGCEGAGVLLVATTGGERLGSASSAFFFLGAGGVTGGRDGEELSGAGALATGDSTCALLSGAALVAGLAGAGVASAGELGGVDDGAAAPPADESGVFESAVSECCAVAAGLL